MVDLDRITVDREICLGRPMIRGMRLRDALPGSVEDLRVGCVVTLEDDCVRVRRLPIT
jgi:hypothetical protein